MDGIIRVYESSHNLTNLTCERFEEPWPEVGKQAGLGNQGSADCQSATQQATSLRYGRFKSRVWSFGLKLSGQGDQVPLQAHGFVGKFHLAVDLVEVAADAHEDAAGADGGEKFILQAVIAAHEVLDAIGFGHEFAVVKGVHVDLAGGGLVAADEMAGQADAGHGQFQAAREEQIQERKVDGVSFPAIDDAVQIAVLRVVVVFLVASEAEFVEKVVVEGGEDFLAGLAEIDVVPDFGGEIVQQGAIGFDVDVGILCEGKEPDAFFEVKFLAVLEAKSQEPGVGFLAVEVLDDFTGAAAQEGVAAQPKGPEPFAGFLADGHDFLTHGAVDGGVIIAEQIDEGFPLAFRKLFDLNSCIGRTH